MNGNRRRGGRCLSLLAVAVVAVGCELGSGGAATEATPSEGTNAAAEAPAGSFDPRPDPQTREHVNTADGVPFSFKVPAYGWERFGSISLNKSETGPQGAEAIIYWSTFPDGGYTDYFGHPAAEPCTSLLNPPVGSSAADLAETVSTAPGTELVTRPSDVTVDGQPAKYVELTVREYVDCDPGFFFSWHEVYGGAFWASTDVGDTIRVWIVDVDGTRLFIGAATTRLASLDLDEEIRQIVRSFRFN
jgi:hypothetical protein